MINIYIDTSWSMTEMGKDSALLYIIKSIEDYYDFKSINTTILALNGSEINDLQDIKFSNDTQVNIQDIKDNSILLSDALFDIDKENIFDISIPIGIDADIFNLQKISKKVFTSDDLLSALEYLIFEKSLLDTPSEEEEDDEW